MHPIITSPEMATEQQRASIWPQILATLGACFGAFGLGTGYGWTSPTLVRISGEDCEDCYFSEPLTDEQASWISGSLTLGALASSFISGFMLEKIGRKWTMVLMVIPFTAGWILLTIAGPLALTNPWWFYVGRFLTGFGGGAFALTAPIYISEISETSIRGALGSCMMLMVSIGELYSNGVGALIEWDILTGTLIVFPLVMASIMIFMPESPYYLITRGKVSEAQKSLQWLRGNGYNTDGDIRQMQQIFAQQQKIGTVSLKEFVTKPVYLKPGLIMLTLMFIQQYCGMNVVMFYLTEIFAKANTGIDPGLSATLVAIVQVCATILAVMFVDRFGRKILLVLSAFLMCISILALGVYFYLDENRDPECGGHHHHPHSNVTHHFTSPNCTSSDSFMKSISWIPLTSLIVYVFAMAVGFGPLPWLMNAEIFPREAINVASTVVTAFSWLCAFLVVTFEVNIELLIHASGAYFLFATVCGLGIVFIVAVVPETRGKSPEDMKEYFDRSRMVMHEVLNIIQKTIV